MVRARLFMKSGFRGDLLDTLILAYIYRRNPVGRRRRTFVHKAHRRMSQQNVWKQSRYIRSHFHQLLNASLLTT
jgi:hypothetical protein